MFFKPCVEFQDWWNENCGNIPLSVDQLLFRSAFLSGMRVNEDKIKSIVNILDMIIEKYDNT